ncbi:MAG: hypothetical protein P4L16_03790 [Chlamydiales bacterium]|nr:hypothetical protein [Chlamydiales bacterium]
MVEFNINLLPQNAVGVLIPEEVAAQKSSNKGRFSLFVDSIMDGIRGIVNKIVNYILKGFAKVFSLFSKKEVRVNVGTIPSLNIDTIVPDTVSSGENEQDYASPLDDFPSAIFDSLDAKDDGISKSAIISRVSNLADNVLMTSSAPNLSSNQLVGRQQLRKALEQELAERLLEISNEATFKLTVEEAEQIREEVLNGIGDFINTIYKGYFPRLEKEEEQEKARDVVGKLIKLAKELLLIEADTSLKELRQKKRDFNSIRVNYMIKKDENPHPSLSLSSLTASQEKLSDQDSVGCDGKEQEEIAEQTEDSEEEEPSEMWQSVLM